MANFKFDVAAPQLKPDRVRTELLAELRKQGVKLVKEFEKTTKTWAGAKPDFKPDIHLTVGSGAELNVTAAPGKGSDKWIWINFGTEAHIIRPKNPGGVLAFQSSYQAKTTPGVLNSGPGGASGDTVFSKEVHHPGTEARGWSDLILEDFTPTFGEAMQEALERGLQKSMEG